eukprot:scpid61602/ scgid21024/ 
MGRPKEEAWVEDCLQCITYEQAGTHSQRVRSKQCSQDMTKTHRDWLSPRHTGTCCMILKPESLNNDEWRSRCVPVLNTRLYSRVPEPGVRTAQHKAWQERLATPRIIQNDKREL